MKLKTLLKGSAALPLLFSMPLAQAHSPDESEFNALTQLTNDASLIVYGEVVDIQYRNSEPTKEQPQGLPHTFVTYAVKDTLRGAAPDTRITLRVPGGADGKGGVYMDTESTMFQRGQADVLFLKGGEVEGCQLVECAEGRFRVHKERVFNGWGIPVVRAGKEYKVGGKPRFDLNVMEVPRPEFKAILENPGVRERLAKDRKLASLDMKELQARYEQEAPKFSTIEFGMQATPFQKDDSPEPMAEPSIKFDGPLSVSVFMEAVRELNDHLPPPKQTFVMATPDKRFRVADPKLARMPVKDSAPAKVSDEERLDKTMEESNNERK